MKIGLYADPHISATSSIIAGKQKNFSGRLDSLIESFRWMEEIFKQNDCISVFCLGDLTDKPDLTAEEITAMSQCQGLGEHVIVEGNHCRQDKDGLINSLSLLDNVYSSPEVISIHDGVGGTERKILLLPYNSTVVDLSQYKDVDVILSHNDIKGYDLNGHILTSGYEISDILDNCKIFVNGHLHNGGWLIKDRIVNLGQLSGMNFSSCGGEWEPSVGILDLETLHLEIIENPYAYRFKKVQFDTLVKLKNYLNSLPEGYQYVLQVKIPEKIATSARSLLDKSSSVVASRVLTIRDAKKQVVKTETAESFTGSQNIYDKLRGFLKTQDTKKFDPEIAEKVIVDLEKKEGAE